MKNEGRGEGSVNAELLGACLNGFRLVSVMRCAYDAQLITQSYPSLFEVIEPAVC